jgi:hypothetical protein
LESESYWNASGGSFHLNETLHVSLCSPRGCWGVEGNEEVVLGRFFQQLQTLLSCMWSQQWQAAFQVCFETQPAIAIEILQLKV